MSRIQSAIEKMKGAIEGKLAAGEITAQQVENTHRSLDMDWFEWSAFQERKSLAVAAGVLTPEEGNEVYAILGTSGPEKFNDSPVEVKAVLTKLFHDLLKRY